MPIVVIIRSVRDSRLRRDRTAGAVWAGRKLVSVDVVRQPSPVMPRTRVSCCRIRPWPVLLSTLGQHELAGLLSTSPRSTIHSILPPRRTTRRPSVSCRRSAASRVVARCANRGRFVLASPRRARARPEAGWARSCAAQVATSRLETCHDGCRPSDTVGSESGPRRWPTGYRKGATTDRGPCRSSSRVPPLQRSWRPWRP